MRSYVLQLHILAGAVGLTLGPVAVALRRTARHRALGRAYQGLVAVMASTALVLAAGDPGSLWGLAVIAAATQVAALAGWLVARRRRPGWGPVHVRLMCGSYLSFVTAALVTAWSSPLAWILPTALGSPVIAALAKSIAAPARKAAA